MVNDEIIKNHSIVSVNGNPITAIEEHTNQQPY